MTGSGGGKRRDGEWLGGVAGEGRKSGLAGRQRLWSTGDKGFIQTEGKCALLFASDQIEFVFPGITNRPA